MIIGRQYQVAFKALNQKLTISLFSVNNTNVLSHPNSITVLLLKNRGHNEVTGVIISILGVRFEIL